MYPDSLRNLIESFKYLPGIGEKTAERLAFSILQLPSEKIDFFIDIIKEVKEKIHSCPLCNSLTDQDICQICSDKLRDDSQLLVVEDVKSVFIFEKLGMFHGHYHVLGGLISPLDGVNPEDIQLDKLIDRIRTGNYKEIILAFKPNIEGETTALYINKILEGLSVKVTRLASGIPIGAEMEYLDALTLERALSDRKELS